MPNLLVSRNSEFFTAICKLRDHSFVVVGIRDLDSKVNHILFGVGKYFSHSTDSNCLQYCDFMFSEVGGTLRTEFFDSTAGNRFGWSTFDISYQAHAISRKQYLSALAVFGNSNQFLTQTGFWGYKLCGEDEHYLSFKFTKFKPDSESDLTTEEHIKVETIDRSAGSVCSSNTCRHTGKTLFNSVADYQALLDSISDHYADELPYQTRVIRYKFRKLET